MSKQTVVAAIALALGVAACGSTGKGTTIKAPPVTAPPPPAYVVAQADGLMGLDADDKHVYWYDGASIFRRPHGVDGKTERLFVTSAYVTLFSVGRDDLYFVDDSYQVRALPKAGGSPTTLASLEGRTVWGLAADAGADGGDVVVGVDRSLERHGRTPGKGAIELPAPPVALTVADGTAYVTLYQETEGQGPTLVAADLDTGAIAVLSSQLLFRDATMLAVAGDELIAQTVDGVVTMPRAGGALRPGFTSQPYAIAGDDDGYVVLTNQALVAHRAGRAPRVILSGSATDSVPAVYLVAAGGRYGYATSVDNVRGTYVLRAVPRDGGAVMLQLPVDASPTAMAVHGDTVYVGLDRYEQGAQLIELTTNGTRVISTGLPGYVDGIAVDDEHLAIAANDTLHEIDRGDGHATELAAVSYVSPLLVHKGVLYWTEGAAVMGESLPHSRAPFQVADALTLDATIAYDLRLFELAVTGDHLYFVINLGTTQGLARVGEDRALELVWRWHDPETGPTLSTSLAAIGDAVFVHDTEKLYQVPTDGSAAQVIFTIASADDESAEGVRQIIGVMAAGEQLVAWVRTYSSDQLIVVPRAGGTPRVVWASLEGYGTPMIAAGRDAVYVHSPELMAILRIAL